MTLVLVLVLLVVVAFAPCVRNDFVVWDDPQNFLDNPYYRGLGWAQLRWDWTSFQLGVYQPLAWMLLGCQYVFFQLKPWGYHLSSLILYAINTVVLFMLTVAVLRRCRPLQERQREQATTLTLAAGLSVALFAIHPLRTEVVAWASCQPYLPCALFSMLAILAYLHAFPDGREPRWSWLIGSFVLFVAALLSKAVAVTLPAVFLILDVYPLRRLGDGPVPGNWFGPKVRRVWWEKVPFGILSVTFAALAVQSKAQERHLAPTEEWGIDKRVAHACYGIWFYLVKTLLPVNITAYYPMPARIAWFETPFSISILGTLTISAALFLLRRRWPGLLAVWLSYLVILVPNLGLVRNGTQITADRYSYVAMMGGVALLAAGLCRLWHAWKTSRLATMSLTAASLGVLFSLVLLTQWQCRTWRTTETLWTHVLSHGGSSSDVPHNNLGAHLYDQGRLDEARAQIDEALRIYPHSVDALCNLGAILKDQGRLDEARAQFDEALRINPRSVDALCKLGSLLVDQGRFDEARASLEAALRVKPDHPDTLYSLGFILFRQGRMDEARAWFDAALRLKPDHTGARMNLGSLLVRQGRFEQAVAQFEEALQINPRKAEADNELAMIWAAAPEARYRNGRRAVEAATRACALTEWKNPAFLDTCAAAHAEAGDFDAAAKWQTRAIDLLTDENQKADFRSRLKLYKAKKPYHEPIVARS
jgi:tetratricopeptide (TPR) repeat protein